MSYQGGYGGAPPPPMGGGGYGYGGSNSQYTGGFRTQGDVHTTLSANPTAMEALESAVALPGVFTAAEMQRTLRRNRYDVMKTALQLREKHAFRTQSHYDQLNIGLSTLQIELKKGYVHFLENAVDMGNCPVVLLLLKYFKPHFSGEKTQLKGMGAMDGSSSLEDTRRLCVYMMDLAVEAMEENRADGVVFLVDLDGWAVNNLETQIVTDILQMLKSRYPEVVKNVLVLNGSAFSRGLMHLLTKMASPLTQQRIKMLTTPGDLRHFLHPPSIPAMYGGQYKLMTPLAWMKVQAEIEEVDLASQAPAKDEQKFMTKDARQLNGMQYAACSVDQVVEMKTSVIRGPLHRNKSGVAWVKMYGILRPEALLMYETVTSKMPQIIIPVNDESFVVAAQFADAPRGTFGFRVDVPGVAGGHLLAACSEHERGNWLQEIQMNINAAKEEHAKEVHEEEKRMEEERMFAKLNMISFDDAPTANASGEAVGAKQHQSQPAAPVQLPQNTMPGLPGMGGMGMNQPQQQQYGNMGMMGGQPGNMMIMRGALPMMQQPMQMQQPMMQGMNTAGMNPMQIQQMQMQMQQQQQQQMMMMCQQGMGMGMYGQPQQYPPQQQQQYPPSYPRNQ